MNWSSIANVVGTLAPTIATAAGGPLAVTAVRAITAALGLQTFSSDTNKIKDEIAKAFTGSSEQLVALQRAEQDFQAQMAQLGFENAEAIAKLGNEERDSARKREIALHDWTPKLLALLVTLGFFALLTFAALREVPEGSRSLVDIMIGTLGTAWVAIISYYFGSSAGSAHKMDLLTKSK